MPLTSLKTSVIQDKFLAVLCEETPFPLFELAMAQKRLKSIDKLLSCINRARETQKPLSEMVDILTGEKSFG